MKRLFAAAFAVIMLIPAVAAADNGVITKPSAYSSKETLARLEQSLTKRGFMIFARLDHAGDTLEQPGVPAGSLCTWPELLDQHDLVAQRIDRQHSGNLAPVEHLAHHGRTHAAGMQLVIYG